MHFEKYPMGVRNYLDVPRVYIDMDGPSAHFERGLTAAGVDAKTFKTQRGVYRGLEVVEGLLEAVAEFERTGLEVFFLTKIPAANPYAATEKLLWVQDVIPSLVDRVIISSDKAAVGSERDFLVDDHPEWANALNFRGTVVLYKDGWADVRKQIAHALSSRDEGLLKVCQDIDSMNRVLGEAGTDWRVEEAQSLGGPFLRLSAQQADRSWRVVGVLPRETRVGSLVAMAGVAQTYWRHGAEHAQAETGQASMVPEAGR